MRIVVFLCFSLVLSTLANAQDESPQIAHAKFRRVEKNLTIRFDKARKSLDEVRKKYRVDLPREGSFVPYSGEKVVLFMKRYRALERAAERYRRFIALFYQAIHEDFMAGNSIEKIELAIMNIYRATYKMERAAAQLMIAHIEMWKVAQASPTADV